MLKLVASIQLAASPTSRADLDCLLSNLVGCLISVLVWVHPVSSMSSLVTTPSQICSMGVGLPQNGSSTFRSKLQRVRGHGLGLPCRVSLSLDVLILIMGLSHCCILHLLKASGMLHLSKGQTKANQQHLPGVTSPDLDLCSLITISDHLILIPLEEITKTFETIYIATIARVNSLRSRRHFQR